MKQIYDFAVKWCDKFKDQNIDYIELVDHYMADDCKALGFKMDSGNAFSEKYGDAVYDHKALDRIIDDVTDIPLLGSAIYSRWRYFNHWAYTGEEILKPENRAWFILALERMAVLSNENSDLVRDTVGMDDLYVFDGNYKLDVINKITLDYHRVTKIRPKEVPEDATWEYVTWDYTEQLIIDRETEILEHIQNIGTECKISHKYEIGSGIASLLDSFDAEELFSHIEGNLDDIIENQNETRDYTITIDYKKKARRIIKGSYDKRGLPKDFADFAETVFDFISFYWIGEILDPLVYGKTKRRRTEYIFCSVIFNEGYKSYYYLTEDDSIEIGDYVIVPAGYDNHETVAEVVNIEYFSENNCPFPVEKTKRILRKCTDEDLI